MINWSEQARINYLEIIEQIFEKWNYKIVVQFQQEVDELLETLRQNPELCPQSEIHFLRKCIINKHTALIYKLNNDNIDIVTLIFNKSEHIF
jgi:plasmid stabilization system protein ParE